MRKTFVVTFFLFYFLFQTQAVFPDEGISGIINRSRESVLGIVARLENNNFVILGTGFFIAEDGHIATCNHVVAQMTDIYIMKPTDLEKASLLGYVSTEEGLPQLNLPVYQTQNNNAFIKAQVIYRLPEADLAVLKISQKNSSYLKIGKYESIEEGNDLIFLGFPFGVNKVIAHKGMVSYKGKINISYSPEDKLMEAVQIDGIVNRGNSGGPLISLSQGKVVGIIKATHGNIGPYLRGINEGKIKTKGISLGQIDFGLFSREVSSAIDRHIQMGIGYAISINYLKEYLARPKK